MSFDLSGKAALVTGASSGLGRRFAITLAQAGAKVAVAARRVDRLDSLVQEIAEFDGRAIAIQLDVTDPDSVRHVLDVAETELGGLSIMVNNAGMVLRGDAHEMALADWDAVIETNLRGAWMMAQQTARHMMRLGHGGSIINIASILGIQGRPWVPAYSASKGGLISLTRALAVEWAPHGIRVNAIVPGYIETDINREFLASAAGKTLKARIPQGRTGVPEDLDGPLLLLASDLSGFMTGTTLTVDGGHSAQL
ncbi:SDR family NAD(P)-dependent oxidoreductase [Rhodovibrio salinarum]|uniref:3-oxoacyl-ACP reductase n=1 Tax=Rhodovibrio salinarum TaxID=1087 RepID=A0A934QJ50_9PROT|nr:glucose 1-dehydrogenase [Rhodovibrio salinarum]MBK1697973.1 3-oxoacyl-ACP reductase [Rhodovibrio salinarum]